MAPKDYIILLLTKQLRAILQVFTNVATGWDRALLQYE